MVAAFALALRGLGDDTKDVRVAKASGASKAALKGKGMLRLAYRETRRVTLGGIAYVRIHIMAAFL